MCAGLVVPGPGPVRRAALRKCPPVTFGLRARVRWRELLETDYLGRPNRIDCGTNLMVENALVSCSTPSSSKVIADESFSLPVVSCRNLQAAPRLHLFFIKKTQRVLLGRPCFPSEEVSFVSTTMPSANLPFFSCLIFRAVPRFLPS